MAKRRLIYSSLLVLLYFAATTILISFPLILHLKDYLFGLADEVLITWILNWDMYAFFHQPFHIFQAPIFYPYHNSLAYSDAFFTNAIIAFLPVKILGEPAVAFNINYLLAHTLLGFFTFLLVRYLTKNIPASVISGTLMTFSTYTVTRYVHLQILSTEWLPLAMLFFFLYVDKRQIRYLLFCSLAFLLQAANSFQPAYFLTYILCVFVIRLFFTNRKKFNVLLSKRVLSIMVVTAFLFILLGIPYLQVSREFVYTRDIRDTINFANRQEYILFPSDRTRLSQFLRTTFYKYDTNPLTHDGYLGGAISLLGMSAFIYRFLKRRKFTIPYFDFFLFLAVSSYILSLGPALQWRGHVVKVPFPIPLPYALFYYLIPGFNGFRNSARWELIVVLGLSSLIGILAAYIWKKVSWQKQWAMTIITCMLVIAEIAFPIHFDEVPQRSDYPKVYSFVHTLPDTSVIVEMPIYNWNFNPDGTREQLRLLYSTTHHKRTVNGTSGFSPPEWQKHVIDLYYHFPNKQTISYLKSIHVSHVVVHGGEYAELFTERFEVNHVQPKSWESIRGQLIKTKELQLIKQFGSDYVYKIL